MLTAYLFRSISLQEQRLTDIFDAALGRSSGSSPRAPSSYLLPLPAPRCLFATLTSPSSDAAGSSASEVLGVCHNADLPPVTSWRIYWPGNEWLLHFFTANADASDPSREAVWEQAMVENAAHQRTMRAWRRELISGDILTWAELPREVQERTLAELAAPPRTTIRVYER